MTEEKSSCESVLHVYLLILLKARYQLWDLKVSLNATCLLIDLKDLTKVQISTKIRSIHWRPHIYLLILKITLKARYQLRVLKDLPKATCLLIDQKGLTKGQISPQRSERFTEGYMSTYWSQFTEGYMSTYWSECSY